MQEQHPTHDENNNGDEGHVHLESLAQRAGTGQRKANG